MTSPRGRRGAPTPTPARRGPREDRRRARRGRPRDRRSARRRRRRRGGGDERPAWFTFRPDADDGRPVEDRTLRGLHPMVAERLGLWRLRGFELTRLPSPIDVHLFRARGRNVPDDKRLIVTVDVRDLTSLRDEAGRIRALPQLEHVLDAALDACARPAPPTAAGARLTGTGCCSTCGRWSTCRSTSSTRSCACSPRAPRRWASSRCWCSSARRTTRRPGADAHEWVLRMSRPPGAGLTVRVTEPPTHPLRELDAYAQKVIRARRRGAVYPYELVPMLTRNPDPDGAAGHVHRVRPRRRRRAGAGRAARRGEHGEHRAGHGHHPDAALPGGHDPRGAARRPDRGAGRDRRAGVPPGAAPRSSWPASSTSPIEWFAVSAGAKIAMDSGTENMDWISRVLRGDHRVHPGRRRDQRRRHRHQRRRPAVLERRGHDAHAHQGHPGDDAGLAMVLTGKQSLDYSGGVSAEDNFGIGGYDRIMGPNGQAQYWAPDLSGAWTCCSPTTRTPTGARRAVPAAGADDRPGRPRHPRLPAPRPGTDFTTRRRDLRPAANAERKKPFDIRSVLRGGRRRRPPDPGALGRHARRRVRGRARRAPGRAAGRADRHRVAAAAAPRPAAGRRARRSSPPARCSPGRRRRPRGRSTRPAATGRWWCWRTCPASTARRSRCAGCSWSTAPRSAGRWSTSTARSCSAWSRATTAARSWCSPGRSTTTWRSPPSRAPTRRCIGGAPAAAVVFAGEVDQAHRGRPAGRRPGGAHRRGPRARRRRGRAARRAGRGAPGGALGEARRGRRRVRHPPLDRARAGDGLGARDRRAPPSCGPTWSTRCAAGWTGRSPRA